MNRKLMVIGLLVFALLISVVMFEAYADESGKKMGCYGSMKDKFFGKAMFILQNREELGLSEKQVGQIKELKTKTKKDMIRKKAEVEMLDVDIKAELYKDTIDTDAINRLIDAKYDLKKEKAKLSITAYAALKNILTEEQKEKMKSLWKKSKKGMMYGKMAKGGMMDKKMHSR